MGFLKALNPLDWRNWVAPFGASYINTKKDTNVFGVAKKETPTPSAPQSQATAINDNSAEKARQLLISGGSQKLIATSGLSGDDSGGSIRRKLLGI